MSEPNAADELLDAFEAELDAGEDDSRGFERPHPGADAKADDHEGSEDEPVEADAEEQAEEEAEETADEPDGDYVELDDGERVPIADLIEARQFRKQVEGNLDQLRHQVIEQTRQEVAQYQSAWTQRIDAVEQTYAALSELMPDMEPPPRSMLQRGSADYDPDQYHWLASMREDYMSRRAEAFQKVQHAREQQAAERENQMNQLVRQNLDVLRSEFPDRWGTPQKAAESAEELAAFLRSVYKFDDAAINSVIDHRFWKVAMDALAYRQAKAKGVPKPKGVEKASPRLVRSKPSAAPEAQRAKAQARATEVLRKTGKVTDREAIFGSYV